MNVKIRLTRKPLTTALWGVLVAAMAVLLTVGAAMMYSSGSLTEILDEYHTSIAVRMNPNTPDRDGFTAEDVKIFEAMDSVDKVYFHTVSGAVSPELTPVLSPNFDHESNECYADVLLVGMISELETDDVISGVRGIIQIEEMILENPRITRSAFWENQEVEFWYSGWDASLDCLEVGQRWVFFGAYSDIYGVHSLSYPGVWQDGKLLRVENEKSSPSAYEETITGPVLLAPIEGTWAEFLADPANAIYPDMMERWEKQQHSLPVLGTDNVNALHAFAANKATVTQGRDFTDEEYESGARVCMLSESVANQSGISVGDTITLEQYLLTDTTQLNVNLNHSLFKGADGMINEPNVGLLSLAPEYESPEEFTVVGLYRQSDEWCNGPYAFTPNTILVPQTAQIEGAMGGPSGEQDFILCDGTYGLYFSIKLKNGQISAFEETMDANERFAGKFLIVDQGFGDVMDSLKEISASTAKLTAMVAAGWAVLLLLYVLLYQGSQRRNLGIMRSLGASPKYAADYLFKSGMAVAAVGIAVGTILSWAVMGAVQTKIMDSAISQLPSGYSNAALTDEAVQLMASQSQLPLWAMLALAAAQIIIFALALRLHAGRTAANNPRALLR